MWTNRVSHQLTKALPQTHVNRAKNQTQKARGRDDPTTRRNTPSPKSSRGCSAAARLHPRDDDVFSHHHVGVSFRAWVGELGGGVQVWELCSMDHELWKARLHGFKIIKGARRKNISFKICPFCLSHSNLHHYIALRGTHCRRTHGARCSVILQTEKKKSSKNRSYNERLFWSWLFIRNRYMPIIDLFPISTFWMENQCTEPSCCESSGISNILDFTLI